MALTSIVGSGALAVDYGHMYVARNTMQNAADAGARAGAVVLASGGNQNAASAAAANVINNNIATYQTLSGATPVVTFPTANTVQVSINHNLPLFLAPVIGVTTAGVATTAQAQFVPATNIPPGFVVPLGIYCNNNGGCVGQLAPSQVPMTTRRYCGNYFKDGPGGNACGSSINNGEIFTVGLTLNNNNSNAEFRSQVYDGVSEEISIGRRAGALPGNRNGWRDGMIDRLSEGRNEMYMSVISEAPNPSNKDNVLVVDFVKVKVQSFTLAGNTDQMTFTIEEGTVPASGFPSNNPGIGVNSVSTVQLIQ